MASQLNFEFEERADFLEREQLVKLTVNNEYFQKVQNKIIERGAKLIVGPRGTGKTHQFRYAYNTCLNHKNKPLAIYVNFGKYYNLEPLLFNSTNAIQVFHAWVLSKIVEATYNLLDDLEEEVGTISDETIFSLERIQEFISQAEKFSTYPENDEVILRIGVRKVVDILESLAFRMNRKRVILLLDDAALTLTPEYMVEFFDVFRSLKTSKISPKASVYPGTTEYGPRFHVGHDAEEIQMWLNVDDDNYSEFMDDFLETRLKLTSQIEKEIVEIFKYASFGIPRAFMTLLRTYLNQNHERVQVNYNATLDIHADLINQEYLSLKVKLPQYKTIIETGFQFFEAIVNQLVRANKKESATKETLIGIQRDVGNFKFKRMVKLLIEAGLLYDKGSSQEGIISFDRYTPHYLFLLKNRAFSKSRSFNTKVILNTLRSKSNKRPIKRQFSSLLTEEELANVKLDLPPCINCNTVRLTQEQKFCHNCGRPLVGKSSFEYFITIPINELPLTSWQKMKIESETDFKTIGDVLQSQNPSGDFRKARGIGKVKSSQIYNTILGLVDELLG